MSKSIRSLFLVSILISAITFSQVSPAKALSFPAQMNKSFNPIAIVAGGTSTLSVTIFNPNSFPLTSAHYHDLFPAGITVANPINLSNTCGGTVTDDSFVALAPGGTYFSLNGGTVPAQVGATPGECTVSFTVTSITPGNLINTIPKGELQSTGNDGGTPVGITSTDPASATLQVSAVLPPSLNKAFAPNTVWVGQASQLTINVINNDPTNTLTQTTLTDTFPASFVVASPLTSSLLNCGAATLPGLAVGQTSVTLNNAAIAPGTTCRIRVNVSSPTQGAYINTIPAGPAAGAIQTQQGVTNASPASANINVQAVGILKTFTPGTIQSGGTGLLTITLQNPTPAAYLGVGITDSIALTPNITFVPGSAATTCALGTATLSGVPLNVVNLAGGTIPAGTILAPGTCTITARVTGTINGTYTNTIPAGSMSGPINNLLPVSANVTIQARAIGVTKGFVPNNINPGGTSTLTITLQNRYSTPYTDVQFSDNLPAGLTIAAAPAPINNCGGTSFTAAAGTGLIRLGDGTPGDGTGGTIPVGTAPDFVNNPGTCTIIVPVTSSALAVPGTTYTNAIAANTVTSAQGVGNTAGSGNLTVNAAGPVVVAKAFQTNPMLAGSTSRLRITITAPADTALSGISISDTLPGDLTIVGNPPAPANPVTTCAGATLTATVGTQLIQMTGGSIAAAGGNCTITVYVTTNTPGSYPNSIPIGNVFTTQLRTNTAAANAALTVTSFTMSKAFFPPAVNTNGLSTLTITLQNNNSSPLTNVTLIDNLPAGVRVAPTPNQSTTCGSGSITFPTIQRISMTAGSIPQQVLGVPGLCTITLDVQGTGAAGPYLNTINTGNVSGTTSTGTVIRPLANAPATLTIAPLSIQVVKGFNPLTVFGGSASTLSVQLINPNNAALIGIKFTDNMPVGMIIANPANLNVGTCGGTLTGLPGAGSFSFSGGGLLASTSCMLTLSATMTANGNLTNTIPAGAVTTFNGASNPQDAAATLTNLPGASVSKAFAPNPIYAGDYSLLTIAIKNTGAVALDGMGLIDGLPGTLPAGLAVAGGSAPAPVNNCGAGSTLTAIPGSQTIQLTGGSLAGSASCTLVVSVTSTVAGNYLNTIPIGTLTNNQGATNKLPVTDTLVVLPLASLGDFVWNDLNADGIQDAGEPGIQNVTVHLLDSGGATIATTTTDASGLYHFTNLTPGTYSVGFVKPGGYTFSLPIQGSDITKDSNADTTTGITTTSFTLASGDNNITIDAGMYQSASLGDFVWNDLNADGIQDAGEPGIQNVTVHLTGTDNLGNPVTATATTDLNGLYYFTGLMPGIYQVEFVPPSGYTFSSQDQGANDSVDSDANTSTGATGSYTLVSGENNTTVDAGMFMPDMTVSKTISAISYVNPTVMRLTYSITLTNTTGIDLKNVQTTDDLQITFGATPFTFISLTASNLSANTSYDGVGDINLLTGIDTLAAGGNGTIILVVNVDTGGLATNQTNTVIATGEPPLGPTIIRTSSVTGPVFADPAVTKSADPSLAMVGDLVTFTITVTNNGNQTATGVTVTDPLPANMDYVSASSTPVGSISLIAPRTVEVVIGDVAVSDVITILINARVNSLGTPPVQNTVRLTTTSSTDIITNDESSVTLEIISPVLPSTGFAPGKVTQLDPQPTEKQYITQDDFWLEIPSQKVKMNLVGVPKVEGEWDVSWLWRDAGYLDGSAFPTHSGNSIITGHVYLPNGLPGPFDKISSLKWSDRIIIHAYGQSFIYEVRKVDYLYPADYSKAFEHKDEPWITLLTCRSYDEKSNSYRQRVAVKAVLVKVIR